MKSKILFVLILFTVFLTGCGKKFDYSSCLLNAGGVCVTKIAQTIPEDGNYWLGAKNTCGLKNLPTATELAKIASFVYEKNPIMPADSKKINLDSNDNFKFFDKKRTGSFFIFSDETESRGEYAYIRSYYEKETSWESIPSRGGASVLTVCVIHNPY